MPDYLSVSEAAEKLNISAAAVRALIKKGELEGAFQSPSRAWLIPAEAVTAYKAGRRDKPKTPRKPAASRPKRETTQKEKDEKKKPAKKKTTKRRSSRKSSGFGLDDVVELIGAALGKSDKPDSGGLLSTLLQQFAGQKRSGSPEQLQSLLANLGEQNPGALQELLKSASVPDLAGLIEKIKTADDQ